MTGDPDGGRGRPLWGGPVLRQQAGGEMPMARCVKVALLEALDRKAAAAMPHVARLLRRHGEREAAQACERVWERLARSDAPDSEDSRPT